MKFHCLILFIAWLVYTINMYSNMKYYENICNCLRVIQQYINRKLKSANCWQQTSLNALFNRFSEASMCPHSKKGNLHNRYNSSKLHLELSRNGVLYSAKGITSSANVYRHRVIQVAARGPMILKKWRFRDEMKRRLMNERELQRRLRAEKEVH